MSEAEAESPAVEKAPGPPQPPPWIQSLGLIWSTKREQHHEHAAARATLEKLPADLKKVRAAIGRSDDPAALEAAAEVMDRRLEHAKTVLLRFDLPLEKAWEDIFGGPLPSTVLATWEGDGRTYVLVTPTRAVVRGPDYEGILYRHEEPVEDA